MPASNVATIAGHNYTIAGETLLPKGKRGYFRKTRPAQESDPSVPKTATWRLSGPLGKSSEGADGSLGHDYSTLETRYDELLTSAGAVSTTTLSTYDPLASGTAPLGGFALGSRALGGGSSLATPQVITHIAENAGYLFIARGAFVSQVSASTFALVTTKTLAALVYGMANWFRKLRLGMGGTLAIQTVTAISSSGATYGNTQVSGSDTFGKEMTPGNDRLWWVRADAAGTNENRVRFTQDDFSSQSSGFVVGDPGIGATAIGVNGPFTAVGSENGLLGFTDEGIPFHEVTALKDARSQNNARKIASLFGWLYITSELGLYAVRGQTANPVGIGSDSMKGFDGFDGKPLAVKAWRESLLVAYEDSAGTTWRILRGVFNPSLTPGTGELDWYPVATRTTGQIKEISATATSTLPTICWGEGTSTLARIAHGRGGRDISDASYPFSTAGGQWFGSKMLRTQHLRKTIRWVRFFTENMASGNTWTAAIAFDGGSYTTIGSAVTTAGAQKVVPSTLTSAPTGFSMKPRLTQVAAAGTSSSTPPQLRGFLEVGYDERPDQVTACAFVFAPVSLAELTRLRALADADDSSGRQPVEVKLPGDSTTRYGYVLSVDEEDLTDANVTGAAVNVLLVDAA